MNEIRLWLAALGPFANVLAILYGVYKIASRAESVQDNLQSRMLAAEVAITAIQSTSSKTAETLGRIETGIGALGSEVTRLQGTNVFAKPEDRA
jgi:hypothetical protein